MNNFKEKISVVIPTFNSWDTLKECISSIQEQTLKPFEIITIDNGSTDGTSDKVSTKFPKVKLVTLSENSGVTGGRNKGIENTSNKADFILFFDHDMVADKKMLEELVETSQTELNIGIITPKIYYSDNRNRIWAAGTAINLWTGQVLFRGGEDIGQFEEAVEVQVAPAVLLVKKEVMSKLKMFDNRYFATYEDTDFCFRAKKAGYKIYYAPRAQAFHKIPSNSDKESFRLLSRAYWIGRNRILFMKDFGNNFYVFLLFLPIFIIYYFRLSLVHKRFSAWIKLIQGIFAGLIEVSLSKKYIFTGERPSLTDMQGLHLAKYNFALKYCRGKEILEIGCGSGYGSKYLAQKGVKKITAYDLDPQAINFAIKNSSHENITFAEGDVETLKLKDKYAVIISFEVIEHLKKPEKLLELARNSLKKEGVFILSTPNRRYSAYDGNKPANPYHIREFYPYEMEKILKKYFKVVELYGVVLGNREAARKEADMHKSLRWKVANYLTGKRFIRTLMNFLPEYPKRLISGEGKLSFKTEDFRIVKNKQDQASDFVAVNQ